MLLCWFEHSHHRLPGKPDLMTCLGVVANLLVTGFRTYYGMASKMSADLGLQDPHNFDPYPSEYDRNRRRTTWTGLVQLHMTASSCKSHPIFLKMFSF